MTLPANTSVIPQLTPADVAPLADKIAAENAFASYRERKSGQTVRAHDNDLTCFVVYLASLHIHIDGNLSEATEAWRGISHGLVDGFVRWQLKEGFALTTINRRLATVKCYLSLAMRAGVVTADQYVAVQQVKAYRPKDVHHVDSRRTQTRQEHSKKSAPIFLTGEQYAKMWEQPDTPEGRRDAAMVTLFLGLGLRCGELLALKVEALDVERRTLTFYRSKVDKTQMHKFPDDIAEDMYVRLAAYMRERPTTGNLWYHIRPDGSAVERLPSQRDIYRTVARMGAAIDVIGLGPHDLRHTWAERAVRSGTDLESLRDAGGWASLEMPLRYMKSKQIANEGVKLKSA